MLFSEPKIPQFGTRGVATRTRNWFQCSSASRKFLNPRVGVALWNRSKSFSALQRAENSSIRAAARRGRAQRRFQCSSASRKFLNVKSTTFGVFLSKVSVLFSEPKIPQLARRAVATLRNAFQCSSASRKFLKLGHHVSPAPLRQFQCSSASRKFLKCAKTSAGSRCRSCFSALQRAENSSILDDERGAYGAAQVSVLFSEPKIPQCSIQATRSRMLRVSVLFSEPKIPQ